MKNVFLIAFVTFTVVTNATTVTGSVVQDSITKRIPDGSVIGIVVSADKDTSIVRALGPSPSKASPYAQIRQGDVINVGVRLVWVCTKDFRQYDWQKGQHEVDWHDIDTSTDPYNSAQLNGPKSVPTVSHGADKIEHAKGAVNHDWIAIILHSRPAYWNTVISVKPAKQLLGGQDKTSLEARIRSAALSPDARQLLYANLGAMSQIYGQACEDLKKVSSVSQAPYIQIMLGDLNLAGLDAHNAKIAYDRARELATSYDPLAEAYAQQALGLIREFEGNKSDAITHLTDATKLYRGIREIDTAALIDQRIYSLRGKARH